MSAEGDLNNSFGAIRPATMVRAAVFHNSGNALGVGEKQAVDVYSHRGGFGQLFGGLGGAALLGDGDAANAQV